MARKRRLAAVLFSLGCLQSGSVWALGLGDITLESFLNEPLKAQVDLLNTGGLQEDQIRVRLATTEDFDRMGIDRAYFLTGIKFEVEVDANGRGRIVLTSEDPVLEPYLDFIIETRWPSGRLLREYTVLVDPPTFDSTTEVISASERVAEVEGTPAPEAKKKTEPEVATGTRVGVGQKSGLAPGEMPARDYSADTAASPAPGARYMISRDETLWQIAQQARPDGVSVHQTMLDIQRLNPEAFIDGNINRIKAGYIVYLPASGDISSDDVSEALAEVRQQNEDWRAGRASTPAAASGPSLRVSADAEPAQAEPGAAGEDTSEPQPAMPASAGAAAAASTDAAMEDLERSNLENAELQDRLSALAERLETLERVVSVKDEQIAALEAALAERDEEVAAASAAAESAATQTAAAKPEPEPKPAAPAPRPAEPGFLDTWLYPAIGALVALLLGALWWRRRQSDEDDAASDQREQDVFAGVQLRDENLEVGEDEASGTQVTPGSAAPEPASSQPTAPVDEPEPAEMAPTRGYGQRKHDEYAADVDTGDALAEADIYIAYGRYPQAIELLRTASEAEPGNLAYRLKLLELYVQSGQDGDAREQLAAIRESGDSQAVSRAEALLQDQGAEEKSDDDRVPKFSGPTVGNPSGAAPSAGQPGGYLGESGPETAETDLPEPEELPEAELSEMDLSEEFDRAPEFEEAAAEDSFTGLEIEEDVTDELEDELDLSRDFEPVAPASTPAEDVEEEDMVFASEGNPMSTKLDLARAYIDMGDEDGARQILEEVLLEGAEDQQSEARALLERL